MANDGKIYITISDERGKGSGGTTTTTTTTTTTEEESKDKDGLGFDLANHQFKNFVISEAKQMVNYSIGNIGNVTGEYQTHRQVNEGINAIGKVANIANAFIVGGVVGGLIAVAGTGINYALQRNSEIIANRQLNNKIDKVRELAGLDTLNNGSR